MLNVTNIRSDFPIFSDKPNLVYLDSTATSLKPRVVIEKLREYYEKYSANVFRGIYGISEKATEEYEETRQIVADFINAKSPDEVIFTRNTTESLNLLAYSLGQQIIEKNDEVVTTIEEHHSNFVPWQQLAAENGAVFKIIDITTDGNLNLGKNSSLEGIVTKKTKILTLTYISNVLGNINPIKEIARQAKKINPKIVVIVDAAQAVPHIKVDVQDLGCDFIAFSAHKMLGPTGLGVLWGRYDLLESMLPFNFGGEMIESVEADKTLFKSPPYKFEAGTPHIAGVIALKESIHYLEKLGWENVEAHEKELTNYALRKMAYELGKKVKVLGPSYPNHKGIIAFTFEPYHPHDIAQIFSDENICIRAGHHCAMPVHTRLGVNASCRMSFYIYNDKTDIDKAILALKQVEKVLG